MKKHVTQSDKLHFVLKLGKLEVITAEMLVDEEIKQRLNHGFESIYTEEQILNEIISNEKNGLTCYQFTPYDADNDVETIRQWTNNPFTLINLIWVCHSELL